MIFKIKNRIEKELAGFIRTLDRDYSLSRLSPLLYRSIRDFMLCDGKRIRPLLFILAYLGYASRPAKNIFTGALFLELLHDFIIIHDDIIDNADRRRGKPSLHRRLDKHLASWRNPRFTGKDLGIIIGDIIYGMGIRSFLSIREDLKRKEKALKNIIDTSVYTGTGQFLELLYGMKRFEDIAQEDIYRIYDLKTARYTFSCPLSSGAILAGAKKSEIEGLARAGLYLGRAFQVKDDILDLFGEEKDTGKSPFTDLRESKKTLLLWHAYSSTSREGRKTINRVFSSHDLMRKDLLKIRDIVVSSGSLVYCRNEMILLGKKAGRILISLSMQPQYRKFLLDYTKELIET